MHRPAAVWQPGTSAKLKHVIAMTDGHSQPGNFYAIVSSMADAKTTVSTVAVGAGADRDLLERIANWGNGRAYFTDAPGHIPQIFARETMRTTNRAAMDVDLVRTDGKLQVTVDALNPSPQRAGEFLDGVDTWLERIRPGAGVRRVRLRQVAPGRYTGSFPVDDTSTHHVRIVQKQHGVEIQSMSRGVAVGYSDEYRIGPADEAVLKRLARVGGGTYNVAPEAVFEPDARSIRVQPLWPYLVAASILLLILDVALRRVDISILLGGARPWQPETAGGA